MLKASLRWIGPFTVVGLVVLGFVLGAGAWSVIGDASTDPLVDSGGSPSSMTSTTTSGDDSTTTTIAATDPPTTASSAPESTSSSAPLAATTTARGAEDWMDVASALSPMQLPSDCTLPLDNPESLPGADRGYRGGVHEGIDFICGERGRSAVAALDGRVVMANGSYVDPEPDEREEILDIAQSIGETPPWTLAMLFGRFVVIDHGIRPGAGHVITIYAHLDEIDPSIRPGLSVDAGQRLGEIGNLGTESAATGADRPQSLHLHWEVHVDDEYLGAGTSSADTRAIYAELFGR